MSSPAPLDPSHKLRQRAAVTEKAGKSLDEGLTAFGGTCPACGVSPGTRRQR